MNGLTKEVAMKFIKRYEKFNKVRFSKEAVEEFIANINVCADQVAFWASQRAKLRNRIVNVREVDEATEITDILFIRDTVFKKLQLDLPKECEEFLTKLPDIAKGAMDWEKNKEERSLRKGRFH